MALPTPESNLATLQGIYQTLLANIAAAEALGLMTLSVDGVSLNLSEAYERLERLAKIPGVAQTPIWNANSIAR